MAKHKSSSHQSNPGSLLCVGTWELGHVEYSSELCDQKLVA